MPQSFRSPRARLAAAVIGQAAAPGPIESHERNVLAITRRIHTLTTKRSTLTKQLKEIGVELRGKRRELRAVLQRDSTITEDSPTLALAGKADAIDR